MSSKHVILTIVVLLLVGVGILGLSRAGHKNPGQQPNEQSSDLIAAAPPSAARECVRVYDRSKIPAGTDIVGKKAELIVRNFGTITIEFYDKDAPKTVENFIRLAQAGYFDCLTFHRVAKGFVIQGGDPTGTGSGGESAFGGEFADELNPQTSSYKQGYVKGVVAMANHGPNTNSSQFFIMLEDVQLPRAYTIFGKVIAGQDVVDKIGQVEIIPQLGPTDGAPKDKVIIEKVIIK